MHESSSIDVEADHVDAGDSGARQSGVEVGKDIDQLSSPITDTLWTRSAFDRMPIEIASTIFASYASTLAEDTYLFPKTSPLTLGAVCRRWRQIAWSTPSVWTDLVADFCSGPPAKGLSETRLQLAQDWLGRSGQLPLSITIYADASTDEQLFRAQQLIRSLNSYCDRWHSLTLRLPWEALELLDASACTSSKLHRLTLFSNEDEISHLKLSRLTPRIIKVSSVQLDFQSLDWSCVTDLTLTNIPVHRILQLLQLAPALHRCHFLYAGCGEDDPPPLGYFPVTHSSLQKLDIEFAWDDVDELFFSNVTLPALQDLNIDGCHMELSVNLVPFISRSSCKLLSLSLPKSDFARLNLLAVARISPSLEEIYIKKGSDAGESLDLFFEALIEHLPEEEVSAPPQAEPLLPSLRIFEWNASGVFPWEVIPFFLAPLSPEDNNNSRRPLKSITVRSNVQDGDSIPYISPDVMIQILPFADEVSYIFPVNFEGSTLNLFVLSLARLIKTLGVTPVIDY